MIGETVGSYRIVSKLSVGGMGTVYRAEHTLIGKLAAVKVLHPELSGSREIVQRFFNEAKATTTIKHPGIVEVFDFGYMESGHAFLTMEFLEGMSLARRLKTKGRMVEGEAAMMLRSVCSALAAAHAKGIVHRDLKPDNIFLVTDQDSPTGDRPKILDFGIAKLTDIGLAGTATKTGAVMGTPTYMSPEQCKGTGDVDHRADLYSLGCIFYELVSGRPPFTKLGAGELIGAHIYAQPEPPSKYHPAISKETEKLIMALLHKRAEKRPQTSRELAQRLGQLAQHLGWITLTSPDGITARGLQELGTGPIPIPSGMTNEERLAETVLPSTTDATTPYGLDSIPDGEAPSIYITRDGDHDALEKPTTLSGAASQSVASIHEVPVKRSRKKGMIIGALSAAMVAAAVVVVIQVLGANETKQVDAATAPALAAPPAPNPEPTAEVAPPPPPSVPEPTPEPVAVEPEPEPVAVTQPEPVKPATVKKPVRKIVKRPPAKPVTKPATTTTTPTKPEPTKPPEKKCKSVLDCPDNSDFLKSK